MTTLISSYTEDGHSRRCDAKCYNAKKSKCVCICRGANHGKGLEVAAANTQRMAEEWIKRAFAEDPPAVMVQAPLPGFPLYSPRRVGG